MNESNKPLKWKVKHSTNFNAVDDFLEAIILECGVPQENLHGFLHPTKQYINDPFDMKNMTEAVKLVHKHIKSNSKIFIKVDCDVDGWSSSTMLIQFLKELNPDIQIDYALDEGKQHGLFYEDLANHVSDEYGLVIIPDASMKVKDAKMITQNFTADIVVLDHHIIENEFFDKNTKQWVNREKAKELYKADKDSIDHDCYTNYCLAVNCTDGQYPNPNLCGAGVVQKFIEAYSSTYETKEDIPDCRNNYLDILSLALIADNMDLRNLENRYYVMEGLKERNYKNEFINELVEISKEDMKWGRYIISMGWNIAPKINGCIRYGKEDEKKDSFRAMLGEQQTIEYQPRRKHKEDPKPPLEIHSLQRYQARICKNIKNRQDTEVRRYMKEIEAEIADKKLDKNSILFVDGTQLLQRSTVTGLLAMKLASKYFRPVILMRSMNSSEFGGSGRNYAQGNIENLKEFLEGVGIYTAGHNNAMGVSFPKDKLDEIIKKCNELMPLDQLCTVYQCDWEIPADKLRTEDIREVAENYEIFGNTVPSPLFAITKLHINASQIQAYGENNNFIRFTYNGIPFIKKYCTHDEYDKLTLAGRSTFGVNKKELELNIIGEFTLSTWEDKVYPEVKIVAFDSKEIAKGQSASGKEWDFEEELISSKKTKITDDDFDW